MSNPCATRAARRLLPCAVAAATLVGVWTPARADLAFNVGAVTDYRYRGISQSRLQPALQGGVDWSHASGFYVGAWGSTIKWIRDAQGDGPVEIDLYGGYKTTLDAVSKDLGLDVGVLQYVYPSAVTPGWSALGYKDPNTTELYGALTWGPATLKYSHAVSDLFGYPDSRGSGYLDLSASFDLGGGLTLAPHLGHQRVRNVPGASYSDLSLTLSKDFSGWTPSLAIVATDADRAFYVPGPAANSSKFLGRTGVVLGLKYVF